ncbi:GNAT family N-acetyltransferase [Vitiosangium sp. GDMCC 1.1324]|uniref:GNAT family N-acetyltransferase n=1 Tax=Vitiosangium sp. (strain GDMCC 1.1324) TaxID=2138576 RepID=UPI000D3712D4|nr:GNAT family N-acetyltransferase [Vitiosangium sp. GDMCC 1.1324]PTL82787.1 GNAT family N-acetyltransferase [Vitiosangium sp. GDMCC 1.1324]
MNMRNETHPGDPWADAGCPRYTVRDAEGAPVLTHMLTTREGRPWADLVWRIPGVEAPRCADALLPALRGWALSTNDEALAVALIGRGARVVRYAHSYSRDLRTAPAPSTWETPEMPAGCRLTPVDRSAGELVPPLLMAYPPAHPDHSGWTPEEARQEVTRILAGEALGPFLPCSALAVEGDTVIGACLITHREGTPPHGGPWVTQVYRNPAPRYAGAGAALLRRALWLATQAKLPALSLVVSDGNLARWVYERLGFLHVGASRTLVLPD